MPARVTKSIKSTQSFAAIPFQINIRTLVRDSDFIGRACARLLPLAAAADHSDVRRGSSNDETASPRLSLFLSSVFLMSDKGTNIRIPGKEDKYYMEKCMEKQRETLFCCYNKISEE